MLRMEAILTLRYHLKMVRVFLTIWENIQKCWKIFQKYFFAGDEKIDLTDLNNANILLRYEITRNGVILFGNAQEYEEFKAFSFRDYIDAKSLLSLKIL